MDEPGSRGDAQQAAPDAPRSSLCERGAHGGSGLLRRQNRLLHWPPNLPDGAQIYAPAEGRGGSDCTLGKECRMIGIAKRTDCHCETETLGALSPRNSAPEARWRSGDAADCTSVSAGSLPARASSILSPAVVCVLTKP